MEVFDGLELGRRKTTVGIDTIGASILHQVAIGIEITAKRIIDHPVLDPVVTVTRR